MASVMAGSVDLLAKFIKNAKVTAAQGKRCLGLVEMEERLHSWTAQRSFPRWWNTTGPCAGR